MIETRSRLTLLTALFAATLAARAGAGTVGPRLRYLAHLVESGRLVAPPLVAVSLLVEPDFDPATAAIGGTTLRFAAAPTGGDDGVQPPSILRTARVVPVLAPLTAIADLARLPGVSSLDTDWFPLSSPPPLQVTRPQIESPLVWPEKDGLGNDLTGHGVVIADLDTGVDVFHPHFFKPDGGTFDWLDVNANSSFDPGIDVVDWDRNGLPGVVERLDVFETPYSGNTAGYDIDLDWLYNDRNGNGLRDYGRAAGYDDTSPSFGDPLFFLDDANRNRRVDLGETLTALGSSKIRAVREKSGLIRRRGTDLIDAEPDSYGHGTWVAGILLGGVAGLSRFAGQAPDAELIMIDLSYPAVPPFQDDLASLALWARSEGARVMLYEEGSWVWSHLDGSSANEIAMSDLAAEGYLQVTPSGNLGGGGQQQTKAFAGGATGTIAFTTPGGASNVSVVWPSLLWRGDPSDATVTIVLPGGATLTPCYCAQSETAGGFSIYSDRSLSPRGTTMLNFEVRDDGGGSVSGQFTFRVTPTRDLTLLAHSWDDQTLWNGVTRWDQADNVHTVPRPATGDTSIVISAYDPRAGRGIHGYSGQGTRIDGVSLLDLAAPSNPMSSTCPQSAFCGYGGLSGFSGTSAALPHAAGAAALLTQLNPNDPHAVIERILRATALVDAATGPVPNDICGMGKIRLRGAYEIAARPSLLRDDSLPPGSPGRPALVLAGANGFSHEGEGATLALPGSTDGDAFLLAHVDPGVTDPEGPAILGDTTRPLVFYALVGGNPVLKLVKDSGGIAVWY
jgi:subtilisin family serine protease